MKLIATLAFLILWASTALAEPSVSLSDVTLHPEEYQLHFVVVTGTVTQVTEFTPQTNMDACQGTYSFVITDGSESLTIWVRPSYVLCKRQQPDELKPKMSVGDTVRVKVQVFAPGKRAQRWSGPVMADVKTVMVIASEFQLP